MKVFSKSSLKDSIQKTNIFEPKMVASWLYKMNCATLVLGIFVGLFTFDFVKGVLCLGVAFAVDAAFMFIIVITLLINDLVEDLQELFGERKTDPFDVDMERFYDEDFIKGLGHIDEKDERGIRF